MTALQALGGRRRLADVDVPDARRPAVLRRDVSPAPRSRRFDRVPRRWSPRSPRPGPTIGPRSTRRPMPLTDAVRQRLNAEKGRRGMPLSRDWAARGLDELAEQFDPEYGGFGFNPKNPRRPKFPEPANLVFLLDQHSRKAAQGRAAPRSPRPPTRWRWSVMTLDRMARGGIRDHLAGGYHRYSHRPVLDRPALREDALRQRPARLGPPVGVRDHRRPALARRGRGDVRVRRAEHDRARRRLLLGPRRRDRRPRRARTTSGPATR